MSRCVQYQEPGEGVDVSFCHSCHGVKMRQKHLGFLECTRGPPHNVQTDTSLVSDHTYQWGPSVSNDFSESNLTNSPSPTRAPELQYTRDGTSEYVHSRCTCFNKLGSRQESIQFTGKKGRELDMRLCWCGCIMIQTWSCKGVDIYLYNRGKERESRKWTWFLFWYLLFVTTKKQGIRPRGFFVYECVCLCVCARVWVTCSQYTRRTLLMGVNSLAFDQTSCRCMNSSRWSQVNLARSSFLVIIVPAAQTCALGQQKWQVQRKLSSQRGQSMEPLKRRASTQSEGSCVTAMLAGASSTKQSLRRQCRDSTCWQSDSEKKPKMLPQASRPTRHHQWRRCAYTHPQPGFRQWAPPTCPWHASNLILPLLGGYQGDSEHSEHGDKYPRSGSWKSVTYRDRERDDTETSERVWYQSVCSF